MQEVGATTEDQVYRLSSLVAAFAEVGGMLCDAIRRPSCHALHASLCLPLRPWLSNGCNGQTAFTKAQQFACWAIMGLTAMVSRSSRRVRVERRFRISDIRSPGGFDLPIGGATPPLPEFSARRRKALPRKLMRIWHAGLQATQLLPRQTRVRIRAADTGFDDFAAR